MAAKGHIEIVWPNYILANAASEVKDELTCRESGIWIRDFKSRDHKSKPMGTTLSPIPLFFYLDSHFKNQLHFLSRAFLYTFALKLHSYIISASTHFVTLFLSEARNLEDSSWDRA